MTVGIARSIMVLATGSLDPSRADWAAAMLTEFEEDVDQRPLAFALGCLAAVWKELPFHGEGRLRLTAFAVALGLVGPIAVVNLTCSLPGFRLIVEGRDRYYSMLAAGGSREQALATAYRAAAPVITGGLVMLALLHLLIAWAVIRRRFRPVLYLWPASALVATGLLALAVRLFPHGISVAPTVYAALAVELVSIPLLAMWQRRLPHRGADVSG